MRTIYTAVFLCLILPAFAAAPPRGDARLRELVVFPVIDLSFNFGLNFQGNEWVVSKNVDLPSEISRLREELKQQPNDIKRLLRLGNMLDSNGQTNESQSCCQKAEQLCRNKIAVHPQDGLILTDLGEMLGWVGKLFSKRLHFTVSKEFAWPSFFFRSNAVSRNLGLSAFAERIKNIRSAVR
jgi:hypothetical protein